MKGVLFVVLATTSGSEKAIKTAVPMATEQLCNAAKEKLTQAYRKTQTPNYLLVTECLQARSATCEHDGTMPLARSIADTTTYLCASGSSAARSESLYSGRRGSPQRLGSRRG